MSFLLFVCVFFFLLFGGHSALLLFCVLSCSRAQGELDVIRHRLEALSREKDSVAIDASAKIEELEAKVLEGELQRRKMHNLIQV